MEFWAKFWAVLIFGGMILFVFMALAVAIGGFFDVFALFKSLKAQAGEQQDSDESQSQ